MRPTNRADRRLSNLVLEGGRSPRYGPPPGRENNLAPNGNTWLSNAWPFLMVLLFGMGFGTVLMVWLTRAV